MRSSTSIRVVAVLGAGAVLSPSCITGVIVLINEHLESNYSTALSTGEVARFSGHTPYQVRRWIDSGRLKAIRLPSGLHRIQASEFERFALLNGLELSIEYYRHSPRRIVVITSSTDLIARFRSWAGTFDVPITIPNTQGLVDGLIAIGSISPHVVVVDKLNLPSVDLTLLHQSLLRLNSDVAVKVFVIARNSEKDEESLPTGFQAVLSDSAPDDVIGAVAKALIPSI